MFVQIDKRTLTLKMPKEDFFLTKPKHEYHLSQRGDSVYGLSLRKERRLLCESLVVQIDERTLILKMVGNKVFLTKQKYQFIYLNEKDDFKVPNH